MIIGLYATCSSQLEIRQQCKSDITKSPGNSEWSERCVECLSIHFDSGCVFCGCCSFLPIASDDWICQMTPL